MNRADPLRVLLVEDDEDDFVLTQSMLLANGRTKFDLEWEQSYAAALDAVRVTSHDLYLVDYRLGEHTGLDLVRNAWGTDPPAPVILLTGQDDYAVDMEATALGVTDYLVKGTIDAPSLERTIRYAVRQHQAMVDLRRSEERYAVAVRATNDGIWDWDLTAERVHFSERWKTLLGYEDLPRDQMAAWFELVHPDDLERLRHEIDGNVAGASPYFENEHRIRHGDGGWRWVLCRGLSHQRRRRRAGPHHRLAVGHHRAAQRRGAPHPRCAARQPHRPAQPHAADGSHHPVRAPRRTRIPAAAAPCSTSTSTASSSSTTASATPPATAS